MITRLFFVCLAVVFLSSCAAMSEYTTKLPEFDLSDITADLSINVPIGNRLRPNQYYRAPKSGAVVVKPQEWDQLNTEVKKSESVFSKLKHKIFDYNKDIRLLGPKKPKPTFKDRIFGIFHKDKEPEFPVDPTRRY